ncbi:hypothetical protein HaLaN_07671, partial [Haematococcus lacustris]
MLPFGAQAIEQRHKLNGLRPSDPAEHTWHADSPSGSDGGRAAQRKRRRQAGWDIVSIFTYSLLLVSGLLVVAVSRGLTSSTSTHGQ